MLGLAQFLGGEFAGAAAGQYMGGLIEMQGDLLQRQHMPAARAEGAFAAAGAGQLLEFMAQRVEAATGFGRRPQPADVVAT